MPIIHCTRKLLELLGKTSTDNQAPNDVSPLGTWHANVITLNRKKLVIFMHTQSGYVILIPDLLKKDFKNLADLFVQHLMRALARNGFKQYAHVIPELCSNITWTKTSNRSARGLITQIAYEIRHTNIEYSPEEVDKFLWHSTNRADGPATNNPLKHFQDILTQTITQTSVVTLESVIRCGLCFSTGTKKYPITTTSCCNNYICDDYGKYAAFSYAHNSCRRNHDQYTLCANHAVEGHRGVWQTCQTCVKNCGPELYVYYGTNNYNFTKLPNPPSYRPTHCINCHHQIKLATDGFSLDQNGYLCESCTDKYIYKNLKSQ